MIETYESQVPEEIRYCDDLGYWLGKMLPVSADSNDSLVASFHQIGLSVGKGVEWQMLDEPTKRGLVRAAKAARRSSTVNGQRRARQLMVGSIRSQADVPATIPVSGPR